MIGLCLFLFSCAFIGYVWLLLMVLKNCLTGIAMIVSKKAGDVPITDIVVVGMFDLACWLGFIVTCFYV